VFSLSIFGATAQSGVLPSQLDLIGCSNRSKIPSVQKCYLCLRYDLSPYVSGPDPDSPRPWRATRASDLLILAIHLIGRTVRVRAPIHFLSSALGVNLDV
jgi:hypothetical protein